MPKIYYPTPDEIQGAQPLNELVWFEQYQSLLVALANTNEGRDLLCIDSWTKMPYPVVKISKCHVKFYMGQEGGKDYYTSDFRVGAKWGNVIRYRWLAIKKALDKALLKMLLSQPQYIVTHEGKTLAVPMGASTSTFYPDAHVESTTVDGDIRRLVALTSWANVRNATDGTSVNSTGVYARCMIGAGASTSLWQDFSRAHWLFDTSSISSVDTKVSATFQFLCHYINNDQYNASLALVLGTPATNTDLVVGDYSELGSVEQGSRVAFSTIAVSTTSFNTSTLNAAGLASVNISGITKFATLTDFDLLDSEPTPVYNQASDMDLRTADVTGTSQDTKLIVILSSPFTSKAIMF